MVLKANFRIYFSIVIFLHVNFFLFLNYKRPTQIKTSFVLILYLWYCCYVIKSKYPVCWSCICDIVVMLSNQNIMCVDLVSVILLLCYQIKISSVFILYLWFFCYVLWIKYINVLFMLIIKYRVRVRFIVFNTTFNNISVTSWRSVLLVEKTGGPGEKPPSTITVQVTNQ